MQEARAVKPRASPWSAAARCSPPWSAEDLREKVGNAYRYGEEAVGSKAPETAFDAIRNEADSDVSGFRGGYVRIDGNRRFAVKAFADLTPTLDKVWLIDDVLPENGLIVMAAKWNEGKTFSAIDMGMSIAHRGEWFGHTTRRGAVLYVSAEGSLGNRIEAYRRRRQPDPATPFYAIESAVNLNDPKADLAPLIQMGGELPDLKLVVLDTLARMMVGGDENSGQDMGRFVAHATQIQKRLKTAVMIIHHIGKDENRGARGHSSLLGAVDTELTISKGVLRIRKQRDGALGEEFNFRLDTVEIGHAPRGRVVTSCVVVPRAAVIEPVVSSEWPKDDDAGPP